MRQAPCCLLGHASCHGPVGRRTRGPTVIGATQPPAPPPPASAQVSAGQTDGASLRPFGASWPRAPPPGPPPRGQRRLPAASVGNPRGPSCWALPGQALGFFFLVSPQALLVKSLIARHCGRANVGRHTVGDRIPVPRPPLPGHTGVGLGEIPKATCPLPASGPPGRCPGFGTRPFHFSWNRAQCSSADHWRSVRPCCAGGQRPGAGGDRPVTCPHGGPAHGSSSPVQALLGIEPGSSTYDPASSSTGRRRSAYHRPGWERGSHLPKVTRLVWGRAAVVTQAAGCKAHEHPCHCKQNGLGRAQAS